MQGMEITRRTSLGLLLAAGSVAALAETQEGTLTAGVYAGLSAIDPHFNASYPARTLIMGVFEQLFTIDDNGTPIPMLAERYDVSSDGLTYTIALRRGVMFHNGRAMTAADVRTSMERFARLSPERVIMDPVAAMETPDDGTFVIRLRAPYPLLIDRIAAPTSPASIIPAEEAAKDLNKAAPIGTGPFRIGEWIPNDHMTLLRFEQYTPNTQSPDPTGFGGRKKAMLDRVVIRIMPEASARVAALEAGQLQVVEDVPPATAKRLQASGKVQLQSILTFQMPVLFLNFAAPPTDRLPVRQAIQAAIDVSDIMPAAADNGAFQLNPSLLYPGNALYSDAGKELYGQADPAKARVLLKQGGYNGEPLLFNVGTLGFMSRMGLVIAEQLRDAGMNVKVQTMDLPTLLASNNTDAGWNMITSGLGSQPFLGAYSYQRLTQGPYNVSRAKSDADMDRLWSSFNAATNTAARKAIFEDIQRRIFDQVYFLKFGDIGMIDAVAADVQGFHAWNGAARFWNVSRS